MDLYTDSEKYFTTKDGLKDTLKEYGVAIIPNVINQTEIEEMREGMWNYLETASKKFKKPIDRNDSSTWREIKTLFPLHGMLLQHFTVGHAQFIWNLRQNPKIVDIFSSFWGISNEDLLVSFDGASFGMPPEKTNLGWYRGNEWLHTDQSYLRNGFETVQSWITGFDVNPGDATLKFLEKSHELHGKFTEKFHIGTKDDWYKLTDGHDGQVEWYIKQGCVKKCITCPAGSIVFWDSRTIHSGQEPLKARTTPNFRCVVYLCYTPRVLATKANLTKKKKAFEELRMTTHNPHKPKLFSKTPTIYPGMTRYDLDEIISTITMVEKPVLNELGLRLAGY